MIDCYVFLLVEKFSKSILRSLGVSKLLITFGLKVLLESNVKFYRFTLHYAIKFPLLTLNILILLFKRERIVSKCSRLVSVINICPKFSPDTN